MSIFSYQQVVMLSHREFAKTSNFKKYIVIAIGCLSRVSVTPKG